MGRWLATPLAVALAAASAALPAPAAERAGSVEVAPDGSGNPLDALDTDFDRSPREGFVAEVHPAGPYRYLWVQFEGAERWVVTLRSVQEGDRVRVTPIGRRREFRSRRLGRTFERLWFAAVQTLD